MEKHSVSKMIGAPPGYIGFDQGGNLTEIVRRKPFSIILLDEVEKAHPDVFNSLLQIMEDGRLTDSKGRTVDFKNTIIIMTSNVGSEILKKSVIGFDSKDSSVNTKKKSLSDYKSRVEKILRDTFKPEFLNRIDEIVIFTSLGREEMKLIAEKLLNNLRKLLDEQGVKLNIDAKAMDYLVTKGFSEEYGARPLRRLIQKELENPLSSMLISEQIHGGDSVSVTVKGDALSIKVDSKVSV